MAIRKREVGRRFWFTYDEVWYNKHGWSDPKYFKPLAYDMVTLKVVGEDQKEKEFRGWWDGFTWCGYKIRDGDNVIGWQLCEDSMMTIDEEHFPVSKMNRKKYFTKTWQEMEKMKNDEVD